MDKLKFDALCKEFPFIEETVIRNDAGGNRYKIEYLDFIRVEPATPLILGKMPRKYLWPNAKDARTNILQWEQIHFVLDNNKVLRNVVRQQYTCEGTAIPGKTVLQTIEDIRLEWILRYIVLTEGGYNIFWNRSMPNFKATIYRPKKGVTYSKLMYEAEKSAADWVHSY